MDHKICIIIVFLCFIFFTSFIFANRNVPTLVLFQHYLHFCSLCRWCNLFCTSVDFLSQKNFLDKLFSLLGFSITGRRTTVNNQMYHCRLNYFFKLFYLIKTPYQLVIVILQVPGQEIGLTELSYHHESAFRWNTQKQKKPQICDRFLRKDCTLSLF